MFLFTLVHTTAIGKGSPGSALHLGIIMYHIIMVVVMVYYTCNEGSVFCPSNGACVILIGRELRIFISFQVSSFPGYIFQEYTFKISKLHVQFQRDIHVKKYKQQINLFVCTYHYFSKFSMHLHVFYINR